MSKKISHLFFCACFALLFFQKAAAQTPVGIFDGQNDIGRVKTAGPTMIKCRLIRFPARAPISGPPMMSSILYGKK